MLNGNQRADSAIRKAVLEAAEKPYVDTVGGWIYPKLTTIREFPSR